MFTSTRSSRHRGRRIARWVSLLALGAATQLAFGQTFLPPGTTIRVLPPDGLTIDANGGIFGGTIEVRAANGQPLAGAALTRRRVDAAGVVVGSASGLVTNASGIFAQGSLSWGSSAGDLQGGANRYCLDSVPPAEASDACVDVTVLGTVVTSVQGRKAYAVGATLLASDALAAASQANTTVALQGLSVQLGHVQARLRSLRLGATAGWVNDSTVRINGRAVPLGGGSGRSESTDEELGPGPTSAWGAYLMGSLAVQDAKQGDGLKVDSNGVTLGADYRVSRGLALGGALGFSRASADVAGVSDAQKARGASLTLYASFEPLPRWYVDGALAVARNDFELKRATAVGGLATADTRGSGTGLSLTAGYQAVGRAVLISPYARVDVLRVKVDGYAETGATDAFLVNDQRLNSTVVALGSDLQFIVLTRVAIVVPHARLEWQRQGRTHGDAVTATLVGSSVQLSATPPADPDRSFGLLGLGVSAQFKRGLTAFADYETWFGNADASSRQLNFGVKVEF